jgi:hypothetical protein
MVRGSSVANAYEFGENAALPVVPVSWGELFDKIAILRIKAAHLTSARQLANVHRELDLLNQAAGEAQAEGLPDLLEDLAAVNERIWEYEDQIRAKEREKDFSEEFITIARGLYQENDRRAALKRRINTCLGSELLEEKSYKAY